MARLRHAVSGVVVDVPDEKVDRLGSQWEPADKVKAPAKKVAPKKYE